MKIKPGVFPKYRIKKDLKSFRYGGFHKTHLGVVCEIFKVSPISPNRVEISCPGKMCNGFTMDMSELELVS